MKQSGHLNPSEEVELDALSLQSIEGHLQTSMNVWVDNNNNNNNNVVVLQTVRKVLRREHV